MSSHQCNGNSDTYADLKLYSLIAHFVFGFCFLVWGGLAFVFGFENEDVSKFLMVMSVMCLILGAGLVLVTMEKPEGQW